MNDPKPKVRDKRPELHGVGEPVRLLNWRLDWKAYFNGFCELHGGNPVEVDGKLVLPDGWSYSSTAYEGPEWPPPKDEAEFVRVMTAYWNERRGIVSDELKLLQNTRRSMVDQMVNRSAPLMKKVRVFDEVAEKHRWQADELNLDAVDERISWLKADLENSVHELEKLQ